MAMDYSKLLKETIKDIEDIFFKKRLAELNASETLFKKYERDIVEALSPDKFFENYLWKVKDAGNSLTKKNAKNARSIKFEKDFADVDNLLKQIKATLQKDLSVLHTLTEMELKNKIAEYRAFYKLYDERLHSKFSMDEYAFCKALDCADYIAVVNKLSCIIMGLENSNNFSYVQNKILQLLQISAQCSK